MKKILSRKVLLIFTIVITILTMLTGIAYASITLSGEWIGGKPVLCNDDYGWIGGKPYIVLYPAAPPALPSAPTNFTITQTGTNSISITWTLGTGADTTIIRGQAEGCPASVTDGYGIYDGAGTSTTVDGLSLTTDTYCYRAWSENDTGYSTDYAEASIGGTSMILLGFLAFCGLMSFIGMRSSFFGLKLIAGMSWFMLLIYLVDNPPGDIAQGSEVHIAMLLLSFAFGIMIVLSGLGRGIRRTENWNSGISQGSDTSESFKLKIPNWFKDNNSYQEYERRTKEDNDQYRKLLQSALRRGKGNDRKR